MTGIQPHHVTVTVGPLSCFFGNANRAMGLRTHHHHAEVWLTYRAARGQHGYPSFLATNDALRGHLKDLCRKVFTDATNEDVAARLLAEFREYTHPSWHKYGGKYALEKVEIDVHSTDDAIGHDNGVTRYGATLGDAQMMWLIPDPDRFGVFTHQPLWQFTVGTMAAAPVAVYTETILNANGDVVREEPRDHSLTDERLRTSREREEQRRKINERIADARRELISAQQALKEFLG